MTSRELLQQRTTLDNGDTCWRLSPLVESALEGRLAILDGVHRVDTGTLAVLKRCAYMSMYVCDSNSVRITEFMCTVVAKNIKFILKRTDQYFSTAGKLTVCISSQLLFKRT